MTDASGFTGCLGIADTYRVQVLTRPIGGHVSEVVWDTKVVGVTWERVLNDISTATVTVASNQDCCGTLTLIADSVAPAMYEVHIFREPGGLVWAGILDDIGEDPSLDSDADTVDLKAVGMLSWTKHRVFAAPMPYTPGGPGQPAWVAADMTTIWVDWFNYLMSKDDPDVGVQSSPTGLVVDRAVNLSEAKLGWDVLKTLVDSGVDVVEYGRVIYVGDLTVFIPRLPTFLEEWFADPPATRVSGTDQANRVYLVGGAGVLGSAGGPDPATGLLLEGVASDSTLTTVTAADTAAARETAERANAAVFVEGTNDLAPDAPIDIQTLIPGARGPVDVTRRCVQIVEDMVLTKVSVTWGVTNDDTSQDEQVTVTFEPYLAESV